MNKKIQNSAIYQRKNKISFLFIILVLAMVIFLSSVLSTISSDRRIPSAHKTIYDRSFRGSIISADGYILSDSHKTYQAVVRGASIVPEKKALFVKLFSIYSGIPEAKLLKQFKNRKGKEKKGNIILSRTINARAAMQLKSLAYKLRKLDVFQSIKTSRGIEVLYGLDIIENGESRRFPLKDVLSPILGYVGKKSDGRYTRPSGKKGLERHYDKHITSKKNGYFRGKRDVVGAVIHDKNSIKIERVDGLDLHLNIPLALQRRVEMMIDQMQQSIEAEEIIVGIMESKTGKVLSLATTKRYDPSHIRQKDVAALVPKFTEYPYEAGSVIKPLTVAIALDNKVVTPHTWFNTYNGRLKIGKRRWITDDHKYKSLDVTDIIVHSSNVGTSQIAWRLTGKEFRDGLLKFGVAKPSGTDLSRDLPGSLKPVFKLDHPLHKANSSYGYGMMVTFAQLFKAYSAFNNNGLAMTPRIVDYLQDVKGNQYKLDPKLPDMQAVSQKSANQIKEILKEVVSRGTGTKAQYPGLEVGGKTGTAHIAKNGRYVREYHSSFYGFANDSKGHQYTLGALVIRAKKYRHYFASKSAVPTFRRMIDILVELDYLEPEEQIEAPLDPIKIDNPAKIDTKPALIVHPEVKKKPVIKKPVKKQTVKELFEPKVKPKPTPKPVERIVKPKPKPKPVYNMNSHEFSEDMF